MGDVACVHEIGAGDTNEAPDIVIGFAGGGVARVDDRHAINIEIVTVGTGVNGADGDFPNAVGGFGHFSALTVAGDVAGGKLHGFRFGGQDTEGDVVVGSDFRGSDLRTARTATTPTGGGRRSSGWHRGGRGLGQ